MRIVAKIILATIELTIISVLGPLFLAYLGMAKLLDWAQLHGQFDGDQDALDRARWRIF